MARKTSGRAERDLKVRVATARRRKLSSTRWLERQLNDPYVRRAKDEGYRGRAAYKLIEIDDKHRFLGPGRAGSGPRFGTRRLVPGCGKTRECAQHETGQGKPGVSLAIDLKAVEPIPGAEIHVLDFLSEGGG